MEATNRLSVDVIDNEYVQVSLEGSGCQWKVLGQCLEDQYQLPGGRLLAIISNDCPYEECL